MHDVPVILTLTGGLFAALALGYITKRLGLSPIVGYLLAGTLVGPHTPGFVADTAIAEQFAEIGVILLMFGVGLQFHIDELLAVRRVAVPGQSRRVRSRRPSVRRLRAASVGTRQRGSSSAWRWPSRARSC
jgi:predicted Kef-type K+ transport protein